MYPYEIAQHFSGRYSLSLISNGSTSRAEELRVDQRERYQWI
jgi:hypothetical protein